jgi:hypothetical protein
LLKGFLRIASRLRWHEFDLKSTIRRQNFGDFSGEMELFDKVMTKFLAEQGVELTRESGKSWSFVLG